MDYCSSCRRHLNGALVCPGCGSYAPDIAPVTAVSRTVPASDTWDDGRFLDMTDEEPQLETAAEAADLVDAPPAPQGRAARRRQRARWKKSQRRAVVATAFALVGGALTVASMDRQGGDRTQAATAPEVAGGTGAEVDEEVQDALPAPTLPDTDTRRSGSTPATQPTAPERAGRQDTAPLTTTPRNTQPNAATVSRTTPISATQPQAAATPATGGTLPDAAETTPTPTPTPPAADDSGSTDGGTESGTTPESPDPAATSPSQLCVLVLCIG
ncbi:SCO2400 family protein [Streptomyces dysideae]|uniref:Uncharacterized protein n=1 Tax=Streptomyces dysideae TaxID=909626 RepID=A0A101UZI5_9ACTN|nr:hypothetical protein [Streptomyces dysideae]KUO19735.1 hypothetical protein AQJ91_18115 [Streptomyces dysideae]